MDELASQMSSELNVDLEALGEHPRYSKYKNAGKAAEAQAKRRKEALERQQNSRIDRFNEFRLMGFGKKPPPEEVEDEEENPLDLSKQKKKKKYADQLMLSEWLVDIPEELSIDWALIAVPVGKRVLVVSAHGVTTAYNKAGRIITQFQSRLPGGCAYNKISGACAILDCILTEQFIYCIDMLWWQQMDVANNPLDVRLFLLHSKLDEIRELMKPPKSYKYAFRKLPTCNCTMAEMTQMMAGPFEFELDGLLFYHKTVYYEPGQNPLCGWLKPWMLPEILGVPVGPMFLEDKKEASQTSQEFISKFNEAHGHQSKIEKRMECE